MAAETVLDKQSLSVGLWLGPMAGPIGTVDQSPGAASVRRLPPMKTTHPAFWGAGWAGIAVGGM